MKGSVVRHACAFTLLACVLVSGRAHALDAVAEDIRHQNNWAGVMLGARHISYLEYNNGLAPALPQGLDSENGWLTTARLEGRLQRDLGSLRNVYVRVDLAYAS